MGLGRGLRARGGHMTAHGHNNATEGGGNSKGEICKGS